MTGLRRDSRASGSSTRARRARPPRRGAYLRAVNRRWRASPRSARRARARTRRRQGRRSVAQVGLVLEPGSRRPGRRPQRTRRRCRASRAPPRRHRARARGGRARRRRRRGRARARAPCARRSRRRPRRARPPPRRSGASRNSSTRADGWAPTSVTAACWVCSPTWWLARTARSSGCMSMSVGRASALLIAAAIHIARGTAERACGRSPPTTTWTHCASTGVVASGAGAAPRRRRLEPGAAETRDPERRFARHPNPRRTEAGAGHSWQRSTLAARLRLPRATPAPSQHRRYRRPTAHPEPADTAVGPRFTIAPAVGTVARAAHWRSAGAAAEPTVGSRDPAPARPPRPTAGQRKPPAP